MSMFPWGTTIATAHYGPEKASYGTGAMYVICDMIKGREIAEEDMRVTHLCETEMRCNAWRG
jgi:hypothetical protein